MANQNRSRDTSKSLYETSYLICAPHRIPNLFCLSALSIVRTMSASRTVLRAFLSGFKNEKKTLLMLLAIEANFNINGYQVAGQLVVLSPIRPDVFL